MYATFHSQRDVPRNGKKIILATNLAFARCGFIEQVSSFLRNCGAASVGE